MESLKYRSDEDRLDTAGNQKSVELIDLSPLHGIWLNTNSETRGIVKVIVGSSNGDGGDLTVNVFGACAPSPCDWGEIKAETIYAASVGSKEGFAFSASYDFKFMEVYLQANLSLGLLVVAGLNIFKDSSGRSNYFSREFFRQS
ncbi:MAG: hypothetical protein ACRD63_03585 [Pyrinomonadaceae bacterium]